MKGTSDNRKRDFMETALDLFYERGYENTAIQDICHTMGVTKGAFYHYFESKDDIIITISKNLANRTFKIIKNIFDRTDLPAVEKLNKAVETINEYKVREEKQRAKIKGVFDNDQNLKLQQKIFTSIKQEAQVLFEGLINTGVREGTFGDPVDSREMADLLINTINVLNSSVHELVDAFYAGDNNLDYREFMQKLEEKVWFYEIMLARLLQLQKGSIDLRSSYLKRFRRK